MHASRLFALLAGAGACVFVLHATGCREEGTYLLSGRFYLDARDCLGTASTIDVVAGDGPNPCAPTCLVQSNFDAGTAVYVTSTCGPYAFDLESSGVRPRVLGEGPALREGARRVRAQRHVPAERHVDEPGEARRGRGRRRRRLSLVHLNVVVIRARQDASGSLEGSVRNAFIIAIGHSLITT
jgi:hypothetical protein